MCFSTNMKCLQQPVTENVHVMCLPSISERQAPSTSFNEIASCTLPLMSLYSRTYSGSASLLLYKQMQKLLARQHESYSASNEPQWNQKDSSSQYVQMSSVAFFRRMEHKGRRKSHPTKLKPQSQKGKANFSGGAKHIQLQFVRSRLKIRASID